MMEWEGRCHSVFHNQRRGDIFNPGAAQVSQINVTSSSEMSRVTGLTGQDSGRAAGAGETVKVLKK